MSRSIVRKILNRAWPVLLAPFLSVLAPVAMAQAAATAQNCSQGTERWPVKVSVADGTNLKTSKTVGLNALFALEDPAGVTHNDKRYQDARIPASPNSLSVKEGDILQTTGWLFLVATETDCDYHIQISDQPRTTTNAPQSGDHCVIVEAPKPDFVDNADLKQSLTTLRDYIKTKIMHGSEPSTGASVMKSSVCVQVAGQLFYDDAHLGKNGEKEPRGKKGMHSQTLWELHPITSFTIVPPASCQF